jgi:hypothetical protein
MARWLASRKSLQQRHREELPWQPRHQKSILKIGHGKHRVSNEEGDLAEYAVASRESGHEMIGVVEVAVSLGRERVELTFLSQFVQRHGPLHDLELVPLSLVT